jgi:hypothetical protein
MLGSGARSQQVLISDPTLWCMRVQLGSRIRIRNVLGTWIRTRIDAKKFMCGQNVATEGRGRSQRRPGGSKWSRKPVVKYSHNFDKEQDLDPHLSEKRNPDQHAVMRIRNPGYNTHFRTSQRRWNIFYTRYQRCESGSIGFWAPDPDPSIINQK